MKRLGLSDEVYFDSLKTTDKENEYSIGEYVDEIIDSDINDCGFELDDNFFSKLKAKNIETAIDSAVTYLSKKKSAVVKDFVQIFDDMMSDDFDKKEFSAMKRSLTNYLNRNFETIACRILDIRFPDMKAINKNIINEDEQQLIAKVKKAYNNVKEWLKKANPDLQLAELDDKDIHLVDMDDFLGESNQWIENGKNKCEITIDKSLITSSESVLMNTIYHELCHCVVGQGADADKAWEKGEFKGEDKDDKYQDAAHNDDIWKQVADIVSKNSGYAIQQHATELEMNTSILNDPHVATTVCYNCGWFKIHTSFDDECTATENNNFVCPNCNRSNEMKLVFPGDDPAYERQLIDDAMQEANRQEIQKMSVLKPSKNRLIHEASTIQDKNGNPISFEEFLKHVDGKIATELSEQIAPYTEQQFYDAYIEKVDGN